MKLLSGTKKKQRQVNALKRLEKQLIKGYKTVSIIDVNGKSNITEDLTEADVKRIKKEIETLKSRV